MTADLLDPNFDSSVIAQRYEKEVKLGEGTYAVVYRATNRQTGQRVAIKKIKLGQ